MHDDQIEVLIRRDVNFDATFCYVLFFSKCKIRKKKQFADIGSVSSCVATFHDHKYNQ